MCYMLLLRFVVYMFDLVGSLSGSMSLYATEMQLMKIPPDVKHIAKVLEAVNQSFLTEDDAAELLHCSRERVVQLCGLCQDQTKELKRELR